MSHHTASLQARLRFTATAHNFALAVVDQIYWLNDYGSPKPVRTHCSDG